MLSGMGEYIEQQQSVYVCPEVAPDADNHYGVNKCLEAMLNDDGKIVLTDANGSILDYFATGADEWPDLIAARHGGSVNVLFFDGHVQRMLPGDINPHHPAEAETIRSRYWRPERGCDGASDIDCSEGGFLAEYRAETIGFDGPPDIVRVDASMNLPFGSTNGTSIQGNYPWPPESRDPHDANGNGKSPDCAYSVRWTGKIKAEYSEEYRLQVRHDDQVWIWVDGQLVFDRYCCGGWYDGSQDDSPSTSRTFPMTAGKSVPIEIRFFNDRWRHDYLEIKWESPSTPLQHLSADQVSCP